MQTLENHQIERWAEYVRTNPNWKKFHTDFINAQFLKYDFFLKNILQMPDGRKKLNILAGKNI